MPICLAKYMCVKGAQALTILANNKLKIQYQDNCFYSKNNEESRIIQLIFEFIAGAPTNKITQNELQAFIHDKAGELFFGYIPIALERLNPLIAISGNNIMLNDRGSQLRIGYSSLLTEIAVALDEIELAHFMIASNSLENGAKNIVANYAFYF